VLFGVVEAGEQRAPLVGVAGAFGVLEKEMSGAQVTMSPPFPRHHAVWKRETVGEDGALVVVPVVLRGFEHEHAALRRLARVRIAAVFRDEKAAYFVKAIAQGDSTIGSVATSSTRRPSATLKVFSSSSAVNGPRSANDVAANASSTTLALRMAGWEVMRGESALAQSP
jgi:hypothetical protein